MSAMTKVEYNPLYLFKIGCGDDFFDLTQTIGIDDQNIFYAMIFSIHSA